jgi:glycerol-3-phosphate dehydrogenase
MDFHDGIWTINRDDEGGEKLQLRARAIVNAGGIQADIIESSALEKQSKWKALPRRGQYRVYNSKADTRIDHPIQPIPTQRTKGIFVFSTIYNQLVVGPTALDQTSRTDCSIDPKVANELDEFIKRIIPELDVEKAYVGEYVGIRPGTDQRDYQIHLSPNKNWIAVAGIRSTGLTASLGIGNYVMRQLRCILDDPDHTPSKEIKTTPLPSIEEMTRDFQANGGYITINGHRFRVTHPLSRFGFELMAKQREIERHSKM